MLIACLCNGSFMVASKENRTPTGTNPRVLSPVSFPFDNAGDWVICLGEPRFELGKLYAPGFFIFDE